MNAAFEALAAMDAELDGRDIARLTLDPDRARSRPLAALGRTLAPRLSALPGQSTPAFVDGILHTVGAILEHFPDNLFWDLDHLAGSILRDAACDPERAPERLRTSFAEVVELHSLFGNATDIRFRYVHDFIYGFDWAKWVRRDPSARSGVSPFDLRFLRSLKQRGTELLELIARDGDPRYPRLRDPKARNPFPFSREPEDEIALFRDLSRRGLLPVEAWSVDAAPRWEMAFDEEREERARALGLTRSREKARPTSPGGAT